MGLSKEGAIVHDLYLSLLFQGPSSDGDLFDLRVYIGVSEIVEWGARIRSVWFRSLSMNLNLNV